MYGQGKGDKRQCGLNINEGEFAILISANEREVLLYIPEKDKKIRVPKGAFIHKWSGVALGIAENKHNNWLGVRKYRKLLIPICILILGISSFIFYYNTNISFGLLLAAGINLVGIILSIYIIGHELGIDNTFSRKICRLTEKTDCKAVLSSPASRLFNFISLGDVGLVYFAGSLFILLILPFLKQPITFTSLLLCLSICSQLVYIIIACSNKCRLLLYVNKYNLGVKCVSCPQECALLGW